MGSSPLPSWPRWPRWLAGARAGGGLDGYKREVEGPSWGDSSFFPFHPFVHFNNFTLIQTVCLSDRSPLHFISTLIRTCSCLPFVSAQHRTCLNSPANTSLSPTTFLSFDITSLLHHHGLPAQLLPNYLPPHFCSFEISVCSILHSSKPRILSFTS